MVRMNLALLILTLFWDIFDSWVKEEKGNLGVLKWVYSQLVLLNASSP